jgi:hypothetical protein
MLTKNEITALSLSPTKKDFVQIWNELLEIAGKLSERWDPTSTNESDPGIVILKALTGIADKLNYNIDKNILEAFMPTAAQEDSMRKLCDMLGYNVKYYRSAETTVTVKYYNNDPSEDETTAINGGLLIPKFTVITNSDKDVSYFTTNQVDAFISSTTPLIKLPCMEGQIVKCESISDNNVITVSQISENRRFYLPEAQIAENGIFIYNVFSSGDVLADGTPWERVDNLNIQARGSRVFKFGYDSYEGRPYIELPGDYSELMNDGLFIYYARTSGANGNISHKTLTQMELPSTWEGVAAESFSVENPFPATSGANIETIQQAYNNFKKTVGTFETLVTCRDYMNKIYSLVNEETSKPLVSNVLVTDIRNDLNRSITICSCNDAGIFYKEAPLKTVVEKTFKEKGTNNQFVVEYEEPAINHFDLVFYPFKSYSQIKGNVRDIQDVYDSSFKYDPKSFINVKNAIESLNVKTIAHNILSPRENDIVCINNYFRLNAIIGTNAKITTEEGTILIETIKIALANAFNLRELDFSEEIPFESLMDVIKAADPRINVVSLNEPALYTTFSVFEGTDFFGTPTITEYAVASDWLTIEEADKSGRFDMTRNAAGNFIGNFNSRRAKEIYNRLAVRNILAGRVPLFKYNNTFKTSFHDGAYRVSEPLLESDVPQAVLSLMGKPNKTNPGVIYTKDNTVYSGQYKEVPIESKDVPSEIINRIKPSAQATRVEYVVDNTTTYIGEYDTESEKETYLKANTTYTKSEVPSTYSKNIITSNLSEEDRETVGDEIEGDYNITGITTKCKISTNDKTPYTSISDVTLSNGEFIRFRAPNFVTTKTYPAYVNYHLALNVERLSDARTAKASTLFDLLNDRKSMPNGHWTKLFDGDELGAAGKELSAAKQTFTLSQEITYSNGKVLTNATTSGINKAPERILQESGCVLLLNEGIPTITGPTSIVENDFKIPFTSYFIVSKDDFTQITDYVDGILQEKMKSGTLPEETWTISYTFQYIPFETGTLTKWENFVKEYFTNSEEENENVLWRVYGNSYSPGRYILNNGAKLLPFTSEYFTSLDTNNEFYSRLHGIYVAEDLGADVKANYIDNNEEYMLRSGEYLYIEYTPSSTNEDGTTQQQESVREVYKEGDIIKPSGFEDKLIDSDVYKSSHSAVKSIWFDTDAGPKNVALFSLGANEQIAIREKSQVSLTSDLFANSSTINIYKNFNNCEPLEGLAKFENGKRVNSSYTLKDGEYIFYTDKNKTELAYFTSGTEVTLLGATKLPKFDIIDLAEIFDSGLQDIPWYPISLNGDNAINFQEYQYVSIGPNDTLKDLTLVGSKKAYLDNEWQYCDNIAYCTAGSNEITRLPKINLSNSAEKGCGWEARSVLELNMSPNTAQKLRTTDKIETSIELQRVDAVTGEPYNPSTGDLYNPLLITATDENHPLALKANLACQSSTGDIKIADLYTNTDNLKSFEFKVLSEEAPVVIKTLPNRLATYEGEEVDDHIHKSQVNAFTLAGQGELWSQAAFTTLTPVRTSLIEYDRALKLPVNLLPDSYGIFSIYLDYSFAAAKAEAETWIELLPGSSEDTITLLNVPADKVELEAPPAGQEGRMGYKLMLKPGLNCVRVNTTCDLYIKTDQNADGILYFDELRLIATEKIDDDNRTQGLNLDQLGYFELYNENTSHSSTDICELEEQLLDEIRTIDIDRSFYYNIPVEANVAIDFNESDSTLNTLMNPAVNYDINNVNNNFVVSKLDINYLTKGIQIARSSRI